MMSKFVTVVACFLCLYPHVVVSLKKHSYLIDKWFSFHNLSLFVQVTILYIWCILLATNHTMWRERCVQDTIIHPICCHASYHLYY